MHFLFLTSVSVKIQNTSLSIVTAYGLDDRGIVARFPVGTWYFSLPYMVKTVSDELFVEVCRFEFLPRHPPRFFVVSSVSRNKCLVSILNDVMTASLNIKVSKLSLQEAVEAHRDVKRRGSHILSRKSARRWRWSCQPYTPAALYPPSRFLRLFLLRAESSPGP
jgi:hypothetical protein